MSEYKSNRSTAVHGDESLRQLFDEVTATTTGGGVGLHRDDSKVEREDTGIRCPCCEREYTLPSKRCELQTNARMYGWMDVNGPPESIHPLIHPSSRMVSAHEDKQHL
jgi:hypothetical protein